MAQRDHRYKIIKPMFDKGAIHSFKDIFLFIPKSVVAADLGKRLSRFSFLMNRVEKFTFEEVFLIGKFCDLSVPEILKLVETEYLKNKKSIRSDNNLKSDNTLKSDITLNSDNTLMSDNTLKSDTSS